jgi:hypothetical protein
MITGVHTILYSAEAAKLREFFGDILNWPSVDAGGGWPIFAQPPSELAVHPAEASGRAELFLLCDNLTATLAALSQKGLEPSGPIHQERWGIVTKLRLPDGSEIGIYEPRHPRPL